MRTKIFQSLWKKAVLLNFSLAKRALNIFCWLSIYEIRLSLYFSCYITLGKHESWLVDFLSLLVSWSNAVDIVTNSWFPSKWISHRCECTYVDRFFGSTASDQNSTQPLIWNKGSYECKPFSFRSKGIVDTLLEELETLLVSRLNSFFLETFFPFPGPLTFYIFLNNVEKTSSIQFNTSSWQQTSTLGIYVGKTGLADLMRAVFGHQKIWLWRFNGRLKRGEEKNWTASNNEKKGIGNLCQTHSRNVSSSGWAKSKVV